MWKISFSTMLFYLREQLFTRCKLTTLALLSSMLFYLRSNNVRLRVKPTKIASLSGVLFYLRDRTETIEESGHNVQITQ